GGFLTRSCEVGTQGNTDFSTSHLLKRLPPTPKLANAPHIPSTGGARVKPTIKRGLALAALLLFPAMANAEDPVVNVYNWSDYVGEGVLDDFTKETGIKVVYDTYDSMEMM